MFSKSHFTKCATMQSAVETGAGAGRRILALILWDPIPFTFWAALFLADYPVPQRSGALFDGPAVYPKIRLCLHDRHHLSAPLLP